MSWKVVCGKTDVDDNAIKLFEVEGIRLLVARVGDQYAAYPPVCPHMEEPLDDSGICAKGKLTCNKHLWQWDMITGEALPGPAESSLLMYEVRSENDNIVVNLEKELEYDFDDEDDDDDDDDY